MFGDLEIELSILEVISESKTLPFQIEDNIETDEQIRLKHRYLDIRRKEMNNNIIARSNTFKSIREAMNKLDIIELDIDRDIKLAPPPKNTSSQVKEELKTIIENNTYQGNMALLKFTTWSKRNV